VIETTNDEKGAFLMVYGPMAGLDVAEFFKNTPKKMFLTKKK
jgi:hypothetical protein